MSQSLSPPAPGSEDQLAVESGQECKDTKVFDLMSHTTCYLNI